MSISAHQIVEVPCSCEQISLERVLERAFPQGEPDPATKEKTRAMLNACLAEIEPKGVYKIFNPATCTLPPEYTEPGIKLVGTLVVLKGQLIYEKLSKAKHCVMLGATAGSPDKINRLASTFVTSDEDRRLFEAILAVMAEHATSLTNLAVVKEAMALGLSTDDFISPGTGDFPLEQNDQIHFYTQAEQRLEMPLENKMQALDPWNILGVVALYDESQRSRRRACGRCKFRTFCSIRAIGMNCHGRKGSFKKPAAESA